jgi:hypothetical protein
MCLMSLMSLILALLNRVRHMRRRIHVSFEEEDTCVLCLSCLLHQLTPRAASLLNPKP